MFCSSRIFCIKPYRLPRTLLFLLPLFLYGCNSDTDMVTADTVFRYHQSQSSAASDSRQQSGTAVFIDYSGSVYEGVKQANTAIDELLAIVAGPSTTYYRVGERVPQEISIAEPRNELRVPGNYREKTSLLREALQMITDKPRQSIFITDFELDENQRRKVIVDGNECVTGISLDAWAKSDFKRWLSAGHRIDFFVHPYGNDQRLYIIVFTPETAVPDPTAVINRFKPGEQLEHVAISLNLPALEPGYLQTTEKGFPASYPYFDTYNHTAGTHSEVYMIKRDDFLTDYIANPDIAQEEKRFLQKLYLENLPLLVESITLSAKVQDVSTNVAGLANMAWAVSAEDSAIYRQQAGKQPYPVNNLFDARLSADREVSLGFGTGADPYSVNSQQTFKIEIVPENIEWQSLSAYENLLKWRPKNACFMAPPLYKSITEAVNEVQAGMRPATLYTYYLHFYE